MPLRAFSAFDHNSTHQHASTGCRSQVPSTQGCTKLNKLHCRMKQSYVVAAVLLLCLMSPAAARPGVRPARLRPTPEEQMPLPMGAIVSEPAERSSVEAIPIAAMLPISDTSAVVPSEPVLAEPVTPPEATAETPVTAQSTSCTEINIKPLRKQWDSRNGYCGEMSLQMLAMTRGIYISQKTARSLGVPSSSSYPDLLFDTRNQPVNAMSGVYGVAKMLGLYQPPESYWYSDNMTLSASKTLSPHPSAFAQWIKQNVVAGRPVIGGFRVKGGTYPDYDHIMPVYGTCYTNLNSLASTDIFTKTTNYLAEVKHTPADATFYAAYGQCRYTGCIPSDFQDMGVAVGPLDVPSNLYFPVKIQITAWSDGSTVSGEPGERSTTQAKASYSVTVSGLTAGQTYRLYRTSGLFASYRIPQSAAALATTCTAQGTSCTSIAFTATGASMSFTHTSGAPALGKFRATGVTYFLAVTA